jgi:hypothetical protein
LQLDRTEVAVRKDGAWAALGTEQKKRHRNAGAFRKTVSFELLVGTGDSGLGQRRRIWIAERAADGVRSLAHLKPL